MGLWSRLLVATLMLLFPPVRGEASDTCDQWTAPIALFTQWMETHTGGPLDVELRPVAGMRLGVFAKKDFSPGAVYATIPASAVIGRSAIRASDRAVYLQRGIDQALVLFLLHQVAKGEASPWAPYLALLPPPEDYHHLPKYWPAEELEDLLRGTVALNVTKELQAEEAAEFAALAAFLAEADPPLLPHFTPEQHRWARDTREARAVLVEGTDRAFVPLLDFVNHKTHPTKARFVRRGFKDVVEGTAPWEVKAGKQVRESYGLTNMAYFQHHGFVVPNNPPDCYNLSLAHFQPATEQWLAKYNPTKKVTQWHYCLYHGKPIPEEIKFICATSRGKRKLMKKDSNLVVGRVFKGLVEGFSSTAAEDKRLQKEAPSPRGRLAAQYRLAERALLERVKDWVLNEPYRPQPVPMPPRDDL